jgi:3-oxoacyl-(acyl-carrier-protein) synthase
MARKFLVGGSEAPLTPFTIAQMQALKIYSKETGGYPCRALDLEKASNTMVLGEGAGAMCLENGRSDQALACIEGVGWATEPLKHGASLSAEASCLQRSMKMAMGGLSPGQVDVVVMHAPGTVKGDRSEYRAIQRVFGNKLPALTSNKWKMGHTLGASGLLSLELAVLMLENQEFIDIPYVRQNASPNRLRHILVNSVGFGGNAVSILLGLP